MEIWHSWIALLTHSILFFSSYFDISEAMAIIALTLITRITLMPIALSTAYRTEINKQKISRIKTETDALKLQYKGKPAQLIAATRQLYRTNGIRLIDRLSIFNLSCRGVSSYGLFQALSKAGFSSKFLWISSLAKPEVLLTLLVGALMFISMAIMPGATSEPSTLIMIGLAVIVTIIAIAALPSAIAIYWATSNTVSIIQGLLLRGLLSRQKYRAI